jgi:lysozyme
MTPTNLEDQLVRDEDEILHAYQDDEGWWTIGVGILIDKRKGGGITQAESRYLLRNRIADKTSELFQKLPWVAQLDSIRQSALVNMAFNLGVDGLLKFEHFLAALQAKDWQMAAAEMLNSLWVKQVGDRARRLAEQIRTGEWQ